MLTVYLQLWQRQKYDLLDDCRCTLELPQRGQHFARDFIADALLLAEFLEVAVDFQIRDFACRPRQTACGEAASHEVDDQLDELEDFLSLLWSLGDVILRRLRRLDLGRPLAGHLRVLDLPDRLVL